MHGGYTHILLAENTVKSQLRDTAVTQKPLSELLRFNPKRISQQQFPTLYFTHKVKKQL